MLPACIVCCDKCTFVPIFRCEQLRTEATKFFWDASADLPEILCDSKARSHKFISGGPWRLMENILEYASGSSLGLWLGAVGVSLYGKLELTPLSNPGYPGPQAVAKSYFVNPFPSEMTYTLKAEYAEALAELKCVLFAQFGGNKLIKTNVLPDNTGLGWVGVFDAVYECPIINPLTSFLREPAAGGPPARISSGQPLISPGGIHPHGALEPYYAPFVAPPVIPGETQGAYLARVELARQDWASGKPTKSYQVKSLISLNGTERLVMPPAADKWLASMRLNTLSAPAEGGRLVTAFCHAKQPPDARAGVPYASQGDIVHGAGRRLGAEGGYTHVAIAGINSTAACFFKIYRNGQLVGEVTKEQDRDAPEYSIGAQLTPYTTEEGSYFMVGDFDGSWLLDFGKTDAGKSRATQPLRSFWSFVVDKTPPARAWNQCRDAFVDEPLASGVVPGFGRINERASYTQSNGWTSTRDGTIEPFPLFSAAASGSSHSYSVNGGPITDEWWPLAKGWYELRAVQPIDRALNQPAVANTLPDIVISVRERSLDNTEIELPEGYTGPTPRFDPLLWEGIANTDGLIHENPLTEIDLVFDKNVVILDETMTQAATTPADEEEYLLEALEVKGKDVSTGADKEAEVESIRRLSDRRFRLKLSDGDQTDYNTQWAISFKPVHGAEGSEKSRVSVTKPITTDGPLTYGQCQPCLLGCRFMWCIVQDPSIGRELVDTMSYPITTTPASSVTELIPTPTTEGDEDAPSEVITATAGVNVEPALGSFHSEPDPPTFVPGVPSSLDAAASVPFSYFGFPTTINPSPAMTLPACASPSAAQRHSSMIFGPEITTITISRSKTGSIPVGVYRSWNPMPSEFLPSTITHGTTLGGHAVEQNTWCHVSSPGTTVPMRPSRSNPPATIGFSGVPLSRSSEPIARGYGGSATLAFYQSHITALRSFTCYPGLETTTTGELVLQWSSRYLTYGYDEHFEQNVGISSYQWSFSPGAGLGSTVVQGPAPPSGLDFPTAPSEQALPESSDNFAIYRVTTNPSVPTGSLWVFYGGAWYRLNTPESGPSATVLGITPQVSLPPPIVVGGTSGGGSILASNGVNPPGGTSIGKNEYYSQYFGTATFILNKGEEQQLASGQPVTLVKTAYTYGLLSSDGCWMGTTPPRPGEANEVTLTITAS